MKAIFVVGHPSGPKAVEIQRKIELEHEKYGDILQVGYHGEQPLILQIIWATFKRP